ncbi:hypothetical protein [Oceanobacillus polygoni]|uniref:Uncharacterized protein n=1 Tax=Oceanobacillus polygoni TaxID=1235259 RepID=A0A9X1CM13_9BACI|nr:hypothetical protein [Oceanobacillus polygoni]MBP2080127.1 hypothetical protein [Oceanobacillus polygoni]
MKQATVKITEQFPILEQALHANQSTLLTEETLSKLSDVEQVFLRLAWFFENPGSENFNLESLYKFLDNEWLEFALEVIHIFFYKDTYLIRNPQHSLVTDGNYYMNQSRFAEFLQENGLKYDKAKLSVYITRGIVPKADITISGTKYWEQSTCEKFLKEQQQSE